jgi:Protein of unknown function (DUF3606)
MADNPEIRDCRDTARINWKERFGVCGQQLAAAVRDMGVSVAKVEKYLAKEK